VRLSTRHTAAAAAAAAAPGDGLYYIFEDVLKSLAPDVIITQSLCAVCRSVLAAVMLPCHTSLFRHPFCEQCLAAGSTCVSMLHAALL
jgi:hypothetical protein